MSELIKALQIFLKYRDAYAPTHCEHDVLTIGGISPDEVSAEDAAELERLGFFVSDEFDCWASFRFGSC